MAPPTLFRPGHRVACCLLAGVLVLGAGLAAPVEAEASPGLAERSGDPATGRYFHLVAEDLRDDEDRFSINIPFSIVGAALALVPLDEVRHGGELRVNGRVMRRDELQEFWRAVKAAREGEPIEILLEERGRHHHRHERHSVRITRFGGALSIRSTEEDGERVEIRLPAAFVDALLSGGEETFSLDSVVRALSTLGSGATSAADVIRIDSDDARVRIWVDDRLDGRLDGRLDAGDGGAIR